MIFGKTKTELKVGVFVFTGSLILVMFVLLIGDFKTWTSGYNVDFIFNFINGARVGAPVRFSGVDIGEVKTIDFIFSPEEQKTKIKVSAWLKKDVRIPSDSTIWVNTLGLLGEKYIEIMPGDDYESFLSEDDIIKGTDPVPMHEVNQLVKSIADNLKDSFEQVNSKEGTLGRLLYEDTIYQELEALLKDLRLHPWKLFHKTKEKKEKKKR
ncbi:MAG: MCE family protein [Candidatus Omnitrophica bacterium]|nr:MCE family protein [Candidatus Omnitrophota bacterium]